MLRSALANMRRPQERALPRVTWHRGTPYAEMMRTPFMTVAGSDGSGMSSLMGAVADAAVADGMRAVWLGRHPRHNTPGARGLPEWDGREGYAVMPWFTAPTAETEPWLVDFLARVAETAHDRTLVVLDKVLIPVPVEALTPLRRAGAHIVLGGFEFPDLVPRGTADVALRCGDARMRAGEPEGRTLLQPGEAFLRGPDGSWARLRFPEPE